MSGAQQDSTHADISGYISRNPLRFFIGANGALSGFRVTLVLALWFALGYVVNRGAGTLDIEGSDVGYIEDLFLFFQIGAIIATAFSLSWFLGKLTDFLTIAPHLTSDPDRQDDILSIQQGILKSIKLETPGARLVHWLGIGLMLCVVAVFQILIPLKSGNNATSWAISPQSWPVPWVYGTIWAAFNWLVIASFLYYFLVGIVGVMRILRQLRSSARIVLSPLGGKSIAGFRLIGDLSLAVSLVLTIGIVASAIWMNLFGISTQFVVAITLYVPVVLATFIAPVAYTWVILRKAKTLELKRFVKLYQKRFASIDSITSILDEAEAATPKDRTAELNFLTNLIVLHRQISDLSTLPVSIGRVTQFVVFTFIPALLQILTSYQPDLIPWHGIVERLV